MCFLDKKMKKIAWILTGILFAFAGACMSMSGSGNLNKFYGGGAVYDVLRKDLKQNWTDVMKYNQDEQVWKVETDAVTKYTSVSMGEWKFVYLKLARVNRDNFAAKIVCYDNANTCVHDSVKVLKEGHNLLVIPDVQYQRMDICIENQPGLEFDIEKMQFREAAPIYSPINFAKIFIVLLVGFLLISAGIYRIFKCKLTDISWLGWIDGLQRIFAYVGALGSVFASKYSTKKRSRLRTILFCLLILGMQVMYVLRWHYKYFRWVAVFFVIIMMLIALLCWEKPLVQLRWKNGLVAAWSILWLMSIISDFFVEKKCSYVGIIMMLCMGFVFFMWGNMEQREELLLNFLQGIEWSLFPITIYCYVFRPFIPGYRYLGYNSGPNGFAMYLLIVVMAVMAQLYFNRQNKGEYKADLGRFVLLGICLNFMWKTQSVINLLGVGMVLGLFSLKAWINKRRIGILGCILYLGAFGVGFLGNDFCVYHISRALNIEIKYNSDFYTDTVTDNPFLLQVKAAEPGNNNRILYKLQVSTSLDELTSGRTKFWKAYLRDMNLLGHKTNAYFYGKRNRAHNGILAMMYMYGVFAAVPYCIMLLYNIYFAWSYFKRHWRERKYAFFVLASMLVSILLLMVENLETPLVWLCWYGLYFVMGVYFDDEKSVEIV